MSSSLWPMDCSQLPYTSPFSRACSDSCPSSRWCHPNIPSPPIPFTSCLQSFPASSLFPLSWLFTSGGQSVGALSSAVSLSKEHSGLISFRIDWFDLAVPGILKSLFQHHNMKASILWYSVYGPTLIFIHGYWKNHTFDYVDLWNQSGVSGF